MCWIFAYNWTKNSIPKLLHWLQNLEYRWYDSAWIFTINNKWDHYLEKSIWKVSNLATKIHKTSKVKQKYQNGIAHTRWATHWKVTIENTHPHYSNNERFFVVHNWIIENYMWIKNILEDKYNFYSDTDSEVIAKLIEEYFNWDLLSTIEEVCKKIVWAYALVVIDKENPDTLIGTKLWSPMIVWEWEDGIYISSDINALSNVTTEFISLDDGETVIIKNGKKEIFSMWEKIIKTHEIIDENYTAADKWNFETFTEKEIYDIPEVLKNVFKWRINFENKTINNETLNKLNSKDINKVEIISSGSSYFAGQVWSYWFKDITKIPCEVRISSEFLYDNFIPNKKTLYIFMSQSWETADVRESVKIVKAKWCLTFWIVNVVWSTISRMCDMWLYSHSWIEVWVASTKNIIGQYWVLLLMAISMWLKRNMQYHDAKILINQINSLPEQIEWILKNTDKIKEVAKKYSKYESLFFLWRNILYPVAAEWSLKLKELSYIHSECYSTWELKHWPLALINKNRPTIVVNLKWILRDKTTSNIREIQAREWIVLWFISKWDKNIELYNDYIEVPKSNPILAPFMPLVPMWIFSVEIAKILWKDVDKPQNLAKSVTVE